MKILDYRKESARDPFVVYHEGTFYCLFSYNDKLWIKSSPSINQLFDAVPKVVFVPEPDDEFNTRIWAPELHIINDRCYIYVTIGTHNSLIEHMFVLTNNSNNPLDIYTKKAYLDNGDNGWAIDGTIVKHNNDLFYVWSAFGEYNNKVYQGLYISKMLNPYSLQQPRYLLSKSTFSWEKYGCDGGKRPFVNEGPFAVYHKGKINIVYSASGCWTDEYCLGLLQFKGGNILDKKNWTKHSKPILDNKSGFVGPGHASFVQNHPSKKEFIFFHAYEKDCSRGEKYTLGHAFEIAWKKGIPFAKISENNI